MPWGKSEMPWGNSKNLFTFFISSSIASSNVYGDYEALMFIPGLAEVYLEVIAPGRSMTTERAIFLKIGSTPARVASLSAEEQILCDLVGLPGVLQLLWSEIAPGHAVVATEPMLGTIYDQAGRQLALDLILSLADQLLSRLGLIHSRSISHGNVTPHVLAMGGESWQTRQIFITDFQRAKKNR
ncbi:hypothetical protein CIHG_10554 [Coccidioides immitis H538.4]|uniref:Protein kinase domain-containing protein n=1 Tax=Coccidioides immitis H538.4 TaxID=396776 RepID=A0A0J8S788_COCIT|nr:hypothetical protein CIHG_10554 [Coccidioides immitis H538.4]